MLQEEPGHSGEFSREMAFMVLYTETARPDPNMLLFILKPFQSLSKGKLDTQVGKFRVCEFKTKQHSATRMLFLIASYITSGETSGLRG